MNALELNQARIGIARLLKGGEASLSIAQISAVMIDLNEAESNLSAEEYNEVLDYYLELQDKPKKILIGQDDYIHALMRMLEKFNEIAPYEKYCGDNQQELLMLQKYLNIDNSSEEADEPDEPEIPETDEIDSASLYFNQIAEYLDSEEWNYTSDEENLYISYQVRLKSKMKEISCYLLFDEFGIVSVAVSKFDMDLDNPLEMMRFLHAVNYGDSVGGFECNPATGEIRYKMRYFLYDEVHLTDSLIQEILFDASAIFDEYADSIIILSLGFSSAENELSKLEAAEDTTDTDID